MIPGAAKKIGEAVAVALGEAEAEAEAEAGVARSGTTTSPIVNHMTSLPMVTLMTSLMVVANTTSHMTNTKSHMVRITTVGVEDQEENLVERLMTTTATAEGQVVVAEMMADRAARQDQAVVHR